MGYFGVLYIFFKNYAKTTKLIDDKIWSKEASYTAQQSSRNKRTSKVWAKHVKFAFRQRFLVLWGKIDSFWISCSMYSLIQIFGVVTFLEIYWAN